MDDITKHYISFLELIEPKKYRKLLVDIGRGLRNKGYVTPIDDILFQLELQLLNLDLEYITQRNKLISVPQKIHEAVDFVIGIGQALPYLSTSAKKKLRGQIVGGLKTKGLRPLQHEFRIAAKLSNAGYDVTFADYEGLDNFDFLAAKQGVEFEVEAKSVSIFSGRSLVPEKAERLFDELRRRFRGWTDSSRIPIFDVELRSGVPTNRDQIVAILEACNASARTQTDQSVDADTQVKFVGTVPDAPVEGLAAAALVDWKKNGVLAYVARTPPRVVVRLRSSKTDSFRNSLLGTISEAAKTQLTSNRPAALCLHIDFINELSFNELAFSTQGLSQLDAIANSVFDSNSRNHVVQLMFSGGSTLVKDGNNARSSFSSKFYNNPNTKFESISIFEGGATRRAE